MSVKLPSFEMAVSVSGSDPVESIDVENPRAVEHYRENLQRLGSLCAETETTLLFLLPPFDAGHFSENGIGMPSLGTRFSRDFFLRRVDEYTAALERVGADLGVAIIPHRISVRSPASSDLFLDFLHPNASGNRILAADVGTFLLQESLAPAEVN